MVHCVMWIPCVSATLGQNKGIGLEKESSNGYLWGKKMKMKKCELRWENQYPPKKKKKKKRRRRRKEAKIPIPPKKGKLGKSVFCPFHINWYSHLILSATSIIQHHERQHYVVKCTLLCHLTIFFKKKGKPQKRPKFWWVFYWGKCQNFCLGKREGVWKY